VHFAGRLQGFSLSIKQEKPTGIVEQGGQSVVVGSETDTHKRHVIVSVISREHTAQAHNTPWPWLGCTQAIKYAIKGPMIFVSEKTVRYERMRGR